MLSARPSLVVKVATDPLWRRFNPPPFVPHQSDPSRVCAIAPIQFCGNPSSDSHELTLYCVFAIDGSSARAGVGESSSATDKHAVRRRTRALFSSIGLRSMLFVLVRGCDRRQQTE